MQLQYFIVCSVRVNLEEASQRKAKVISEMPEESNDDFDRKWRDGVEEHNSMKDLDELLFCASGCPKATHGKCLDTHGGICLITI